MFSQYDIFDACKSNNLKLLKECLDSGVDPNLEDFDSRSSPLHYAASNGSKNAMELLLERGAVMNAQNDRGHTPLHHLVMKRFDVQAYWLVRMGADMNLPDRKGSTARDLAHSFVQKELDEAAAGKGEAEKAPKPLQAMESTPHVEMTKEEIMKIYLQNGSYKTIRLNSTHTAGQLAALVAEKIQMSDCAVFFEVFEIKKEQQRKLTSGENLWDLRRQWPMIFGATGNETHLHCKFMVCLKKGAPEAVAQRYERAMH